MAEFDNSCTEASASEIEPFVDERLGEPFVDERLGEPFVDERLGEPFVDERLGEPFVDERLGEIITALLVTHIVIEKHDKQSMSSETCCRSGCQALQNKKMAEEIKFLMEQTNKKNFIRYNIFIV